MLPVMTIIPRRSGVPAAASLSASQASAFTGLPITSAPLPLPTSWPLIESRAVARARSRLCQSVIGVPSTTPAFHTFAGHHRRGIQPLVIIAQILDEFDCGDTALDRCGD